MHVCRVGQNRINTPYMTVYLVVFLPKILYIHRIYMVLANPTCVSCAFADASCAAPSILRVGQNHIYTVCVRYVWQGNHQTYGHIRCKDTVLADPRYTAMTLR